ncbi:MAG: SDR family NAD(P)-dependent oxidoreductase [Alphaproteobacteria bacterium]|nr:MAG: SDR family NAD(P)-dependent oxidoreductase [Alphaproteobacteria bacterium]
MSGSWIVLGASSAMARAFAREAARRGLRLVLCGRDMEDMEATAADLRIRHGVEVELFRFDARDAETHRELARRAAAWEGPLSVAVFIASMPPQEEIDEDPELIAGMIADGYGGVLSVLHRLAPLIERRGGTVLGIGSVAGDRGRLGNYVYGSVKAGMHTYLAGLRNRLGRAGAHVVTVKPGFVDTAMTWGLPGLFLVASPEDVARDCWRAIEKRRNVIYTPWFWRWIMLIIRMIPEAIFKRLSI